MSRTTIDVHILQTVPPSNINRDDTGSPKTAIYGGVRRSRVSSQAWKRATRRSFSELLDTANLGVRTKKVVDLVAEQIVLQSADHAEHATELAADALKAAGIALSAPRTKKGEVPRTAESNYLIFLGRRQASQLAALAIEAEQDGTAIDKKAAKDAANTHQSIDVALFGRMVADATELNVDAAAQVAHAISVHAADTEYDYFTAVDDRAPDDNAGAGMIGTVEFTSSTLYRYSTVNIDALQNNLGDAAATVEAVTAFLRAFITSMPTGKQNTFANRTLPDAVVVTVREGQPVNLVGAFEEAIVASAGSTRMRQASSNLARYSAEIDRAYGAAAVAAFVVRVGDGTAPLAELGTETSLEGLLEEVGKAVAGRISGPA